MPRPLVNTPQRAWQRMLSGRMLNLADPSPLDIEIEDIAHGLARVARWNGQTKGRNSLSVAQHSVIVEQISRKLKPNLQPKWALASLLHDGPEYVIGDMISPFKSILGEKYSTIEDKIQQAIHRRFLLPAILPENILVLIKKADKISAYFEATYLAGFKGTEAAKLFGRPQEKINVNLRDLTPWSVEVAQRKFLNRFELLTKGFCK